MPDIVREALDIVWAGLVLVGARKQMSRFYHGKEHLDRVATFGADYWRLRRRYCLTGRACHGERWAELASEGDPMIQFFVYQAEFSDNDRYHLQGYVELNGCMEYAGIWRLFGDGVHIEAARGSREQNIAYCTKEQTRVRGGANGLVECLGEE